MKEAVRERLLRLLDDYDDFAQALAPDAFSSSMPGRSNTIGQQLWCVVGGHESGVKAIEHGEWTGFDCSLTETSSKEKVVEALNKSSDLVRSALSEENWTPLAERMALFIFEHDAMHQGQLIRFGYALDLRFPQSWADHWHLTE